MTNREQLIYDFLKNSRFLLTLSGDKTKQQHYNVRQINLFSDLQVTEKELKTLENKGYLTHTFTKYHGNCYYAI